MEQETSLVKKGDLERVVSDMMTVERTIIQDLEKIVPSIETEKIKTGLQTQLTRHREVLVALEAGFVPIDRGYFTRVDTKSKWNKRAVQEAIKSMPPEIKEAWDRAEKLGVFKAFSISTAGDPILVGKAGNKNFFIGSWVCLTGGLSVGIRVMK